MKALTRLAIRMLSLALLSGLAACKPEARQTERQATATAQASPAAQASQPWRLPKALPAGPAGELVRYGKDLIARTPELLGPAARNPGLRLAGNRLACANCHLQAGQQAHALGYVGITPRFPQYRPRENGMQSLADRINGCMQRSLNGKPLPAASREMQAMLAYMAWLSQGYGKDDKVAGQGTPELPHLDRAADPARGAKVFAARCAACHQPDGQGLPNGKGGYLYPPLWGPDSFNTGAGMHRLLTAARYIKANMPLGQATLSREEAFDVAAYLNSQPRPVMPGLARDFPDRSKKPVDAPFPPWDDSFSLTQHKYGPYAPILAARKAKSAN